MGRDGECQCSSEYSLGLPIRAPVWDFLPTGLGAPPRLGDSFDLFLRSGRTGMSPWGYDRGLSSRLLSAFSHRFRGCATFLDKKSSFLASNRGPVCQLFYLFVV